MLSSAKADAVMKGIPISQNVAVTGEISIRGNIKAVGGIYEKIYGQNKQA
ncbi:hypothetical protein M1N04_00515 [Peptococcaceae bacterium]|nr:hypothetical protein [Peptococcaceae bacterium]